MTRSRLLPAELALQHPDGRPAQLGDLTGRGLLVVQLVRYFGCLPCQDWLIALDSAAGRLADLGARPIAIGGSADHQARWPASERGVTMPLLLDPDHVLRAAVGAERPLGVRLADPRGLASYARSVAHGNRPKRITHDTVRVPGVVMIGSDLEVLWVHVGARIGDYPPLEAVIERVRILAGRGARTLAGPDIGRGRLDRSTESRQGMGTATTGFPAR